MRIFEYMAQRHSGYDRKERDTYHTPDWVTDCAVRAIQLPRVLWEPAAGTGQMVNRLKHHGFEVVGSDIHGSLFRETNFLHCWQLPDMAIRGIFTNPPFNLADAFIDRALELMRPVHGMVVLLLPTDFDHAAGRDRIFADCPHYAGQVKLTKRIVWFEREDGEKPHPSANHSWHVWDYRHKGLPWIRYERSKDAAGERAGEAEPNPVEAGVGQ